MDLPLILICPFSFTWQWTSGGVWWLGTEADQTSWSGQLYLWSPCRLLWYRVICELLCLCIDLTWTRIYTQLSHLEMDEHELVTIILWGRGRQLAKLFLTSTVVNQFQRAWPVGIDVDQLRIWLWLIVVWKSLLLLYTCIACLNQTLSF